MWQIRQLEAFQSVMSHGTLTRAAAALHISQPAVSKLIAELEKSCGFRLFIREGNKLTVTVEGKLLHNEVQQLFISSNQIRQKAIEIREKRFGTLSIAAFPALATRVLPGIVKSFRELHADVRPLLTGASSRFLIDWVTAQRSDVGISLVNYKRPGIKTYRIMEIEGVCVMPPDCDLTEKYLIRPEDFADRDFIALTTQDRTQFLVEEFFRGQELGRNVVVESQMSEAACQLVAEGAGIAIVEPFSAMGFGKEELVVKPIDPPVYFDLWMIVPTYQPLSMITRSFIRHFQQQVEELLVANQMRYRTVLPASENYLPDR